MKGIHGMTLREFAGRCGGKAKEAAARVFSMPSAARRMQFVSTAFKELFLVRNVVMNVKEARLAGVPDSEIVDGLMEAIGILEAMHENASESIDNGK